MPQTLLDQAASPVRLDKWLWYARFFKTRNLAAKLISAGKLRVNGQLTSKPHRPAQIGQVLTFAQGRHIRVIRIETMAVRRGQAAEAALLYTDLDPPDLKRADPSRAVQGSRFELRLAGSGRPTKKNRRLTTRLKDPF